MAVRVWRLVRAYVPSVGGGGGWLSILAWWREGVQVTHTMRTVRTQHARAPCFDALLRTLGAHPEFSGIPPPFETIIYFAVLPANV